MRTLMGALAVASLAAAGAGCRERTGSGAPAGSGGLIRVTGTDAAGPSASPSAAPAERPSGPRLVVLGFDGVDPRRAEHLLRAGKLPALAALGARGYLGPLRTTNPPQSPVAWATFSTGMPPGEHGVFDFVGRDPTSYLPEISTTRVTHAEIHGDEVIPAMAENLRRGEAFWDVIARRGVPTLALRVPYNYPLPPDGATALAGLGIPDARGINSSFTLLTADPERAAEPAPAGGQLELLRGDGRSWQAMLAGPTVTVDGSRQKTYVPVAVRRDGDRLRVEAGGVTQTLGVGETGSYVTVSFVPAPSLTIRAATRFTVRAAAPTPEIYVEPLSIVPAAPYLPVSTPLAYGVDLWRRNGPFKTVGWIDDTSALGAGAMDEPQFLREAFATMRLEGGILRAALERHDARIVVSVSVSPDRIEHMFYRYVDPVHPEPAADPSFVSSVDDAYLEMDRRIAEARAALAPEDTLLVVSDHGFGSFRRGFNVNTWLRRQGYLVLRKGVKEPRDFFADVDWSRTRAYAMGTGSIYLNIRGREARGVVAPEQAPALARAIARKIVEVRDGKRRKVVLAAYLGDDLYAGPERSGAGDVRVALADGYRASWATSLGGIPPDLFEDNTKKWSGDHASARPEDMPGILVSSRPLAVKDPGLEDIAATAYRFAGVAPPAGTVGRPLF